ncbi:MAG TPA: hypothetical protein VFZ48_05440 [Candidatus Saccharimonadales bacterium]
MAQQDKAAQDLENYNYYENSLKHWRRYGSWFSWGSPIGLGLFCISIAITLWILSQAFGWR